VKLKAKTVSGCTINIQLIHKNPLTVAAMGKSFTEIMHK